MALSISRARIGRLDELAPLWAQMQSHHESVAPDALTGEVAGFRDPDGSWARWRASYEAWFAAGDAVLHVAEVGDGRVAGYAMVRLTSASWSQLATPETIAEIESLSVGREHRGRGLGSRLIAAVHTDLRERGIELLTLAVFAGNEPAAALRRVRHAAGADADDRARAAGRLEARPDAAGAERDRPVLSRKVRHPCLSRQDARSQLAADARGAISAPGASLTRCRSAALAEEQPLSRPQDVSRRSRSPRSPRPCATSTVGVWRIIRAARSIRHTQAGLAREGRIGARARPGSCLP